MSLIIAGQQYNIGWCYWRAGEDFRCLALPIPFGYVFARKYLCLASYPFERHPKVCTGTHAHLCHIAANVCKSSVFLLFRQTNAFLLDPLLMNYMNKPQWLSYNSHQQLHCVNPCYLLESVGFFSSSLLITATVQRWSEMEQRHCCEAILTKRSLLNFFKHDSRL